MGKQHPTTKTVQKPKTSGKPETIQKPKASGKPRTVQKPKAPDKPGAASRSKSPAKKKTPLRKEAQLKEKLKQARQEIDLLKDRLLRTAAELDNFRKRTEKALSQRIGQANLELILDILPVIDDLERSLKTSPTEGGHDFRRGIEMIYEKWLSILRNRGLESLEALGQPFDVEMHDALLQIEKEGEPPNIVLEVIEKGYALNGRVIRHAKVVVSK